MVDPANLESSEALEALEQAAGILRAGGLVALPTETVYGLGANALDPAAVSRIFAAKQRPAWDPIIVHISDEAMLHGINGMAGLVERVPEAARKLMAAFWPGPLTLLLPRTAAVPDVVTAGRPLVGVRMPAHPVALELIRRAGVPVAAVTSLQIREIAGAVEIYHDSGAPQARPREALPSPGLGLRHYAPRARLLLIEGDLAVLAARLEGAVQDLPEDQVGVMLPDGVHAPAGATVFAWGHWSAPEELARTLYAGLRRLDDQGCTVILCPLPPADGIGAAIRDRLLKAGNRE